jgi:hypothetical protein
MIPNEGQGRSTAVFPPVVTIEARTVFRTLNAQNRKINIEL